MDRDEFLQQLDALMAEAMDSETIAAFDAIGALEFYKAMILNGMLEDDEDEEGEE